MAPAQAGAVEPRNLRKTILWPARRSSQSEGGSLDIGVWNFTPLPWRLDPGVMFSNVPLEVVRITPAELPGHRQRLENIRVEHWMKLRRAGLPSVARNLKVEPVLFRPSDFHSLRHRATSLLKSAGVSDAVAMEFIGHDSKSVSRQYTHIPTEMLKQAAAKMPDILKHP